MAQLDGKYAEEVEDVICNPPAENKYAALKEQLIERLSDSDSTCVRKLLESEEIGDRTPTQFWRHLKKLADSSVSDEFLTEMWKNRLPIKTQLVLAATSDKDGSKLAERADRVHDIPAEKGSVAAVSGSLEIDRLQDELKHVRLQLSAVLNHSRGPRRNSRTPAHSPSRDHSNDRQQVRRAKSPSRRCWYHVVWGNKAKKCKSPCTWAAGNEENRRQ